MSWYRRDYISLQENIPADRLETLDLEKLEKIKIKAEKLEKNIMEKLVIYQANLETINQVLESKAKKDPSGEDYAN